MVQPIALCIENLDAHTPKDRYVCCVATPGYDIALGLDEKGGVIWREEERLAHELWVSADQQLMLVRRTGRPAIVVTRAGRSLSLPYDKPVVLLDCDRIDVQGVHLRIHIHGETDQVVAPSFWEPERSAGTVAAIATAVAISASALGCKSSSTSTSELTPATVIHEPEAPQQAPPVETGEAAMGEPEDAETGENPDGSQEEGPAAAASSASTAVPTPTTVPTRKPPIEVRVHPPKPVPPRRDGGY